MPDPVVLIGVKESGALGAVGLYPNMEAARDAVQSGAVPAGYFYSVMTPPMGQTYGSRDGYAPTNIPGLVNFAPRNHPG